MPFFNALPDGVDGDDDNAKTIGAYLRTAFKRVWQLRGLAWLDAGSVPRLRATDHLSIRVYALSCLGVAKLHMFRTGMESA